MLTLGSLFDGVGGFCLAAQRHGKVQGVRQQCRRAVRRVHNARYKKGVVSVDKLFTTYEIIYSDPPWPQKKGNKRKCRPNQEKSLDYETMSIEECFKAQDPFFLQTAEKHNVFLWAIDKFLFEIEQEMTNRGYKLHARFIWDKGNGVAPAFTVRFSHEYLLWFYRQGKMLMPCKKMQGKYMTVMREAATYHSHKPLCAYKMLEDMFPESRKIELFARNKRDGWDCWGKEIKINDE